MANELQTFYSSGSQTSAAFTNEPRKSIGGIVTTIKIPDTIRNLFGTVSLKQLSEGGVEFRCIFLENVGTASPSQDITNLKFFFDVPILAPVDDPANLSPAPVTGDKHIVPEGGKGEWFVNGDIDPLVNTVIGKQATFNGTGWDFTFAPFGQYEAGFITPIDIAIDAKTTLLDSFVPPIENVFEAPAGITFVSANTVANIATIGTGDLDIGKRLGMWIKRTVNAISIQRFDLDLDEGGIVVEEKIPLEFTYDTP